MIFKYCFWVRTSLVMLNLFATNFDIEPEKAFISTKSRYNFLRSSTVLFALKQNAVFNMERKFFHFLLGLKKITQHTTSKTYSFIPIQDFTKSLTDIDLYDKYNLSDKEINFIESMVRPMEE